MRGSKRKVREEAVGANRRSKFFEGNLDRKESEPGEECADQS